MPLCEYPGATGATRCGLASPKPSLCAPHIPAHPRSKPLCPPHRFTTKKEKKICSSLTSLAVQKLIRSLEEKQKNPPKKPRSRSRRQNGKRV